MALLDSLIGAATGGQQTANASGGAGGGDLMGALGGLLRR